MNFSIPGLEGYFGGKGSSGVPQQIINIIPPHETLIIPFLGHCAITRSIKPVKQTILIETDRLVFETWCMFFFEKCGFIPDDLEKHTSFLFDIDEVSYVLKNTCAIEYLENLELIVETNLYNKPLFYHDPPYRLETRCSGTRYLHELTDEQHERFLCAANKIDAPQLISHYKNDMYDSYLKGWNTISFMSQTRAGKPRRETVYFNYEKPTELHDYSFYGDNYRIRELNKIKAGNLVAKFERMKPLEKNYYLNALQQSGVISHR
jgi:site-specific DNA-adenine methylase